MTLVSRKIRAHGKLLLSSEYLVLFGARALAIPTSFGHELVVSEDSNSFSHEFSWETYVRGEKYFTGKFDSNGKEIYSSDKPIATILEQVFKRIIEQKGSDFITLSGINSFRSNLDFPMTWGLGSSSTLISAISHWAEVDDFGLHRELFGGSGYDIACARADGPILYQLLNDQPKWERVAYSPDFSDHLFFVHLNRKENTKEAISLIEKRKSRISQSAIEHLSAITDQLLNAGELKKFTRLMNQHEQILAELLGKKTVKEELFPDYGGMIKSLGAWGGDFILAGGLDNDMDYFRKMGYNTVIPYGKMALKS